MTNKPKPMKVKKPNPVKLMNHVNMYDPAFKKAVILYAEKKSNSEAQRRYGIHESSIRRWRKIKAEILEKAKKPSKRPKSLKPAVGSKAVSNKIDSMPLELRLKTPTPSTSSLHSSTSEQEPDTLHSHALSPTKLKVTRQSTKPPPVSPKPATPPPPIVEDVCIKWSGHHTNMQSSFPHLLLKEQYVDATLVAEGKSLKCHRVILSSCSPYFEDVLSGIGPFQHPILFMKDVPFWILKAMCDFMYAGEVKVAPDKLQEYLIVARSLKLKGVEEEDTTVPACQIKSEPGLTPERKSDVKCVREKSREIKDTKEKVKEVKEVKEQKEKIKDTREKIKEVKEKEKEVRERIKDSKETRERRRYHLSSPPKEMPLLKSAKASKLVPPQSDVEMPVLKSSKITRPTYVNKRTEKKVDRSEPKIEKIEKPPDTSNIYDPLGLLQAVYEEPTNKDVKETKPAYVKKAVPKKLKKRKISDDREESPPPVLSRKGTRSRPNRKIPKFYHPAFDRPVKRRELEESTIIREPHTDQADPLMEVDTIKSEPLDMMDDNIDIEDNLIEYDQQEFSLPEMGHETDTFASSSYPSKLRGIKKIKKERNSPILEPPVITSDSVKIVDIADFRDSVENNVLLSEDPLNFSPNSSNLAITNVDSVMEKEDSLGICTDMGFRISEVMSAAEEGSKGNETESKDLGIIINNVIGPSDTKTVEDKLLLKISSVVGEKFDSSAIKMEKDFDSSEEDAGGHTRRICVRKDLEENILEFEFMDNSEEIEEKHIPGDVIMNSYEEVHDNTNIQNVENLNIGNASDEVAHTSSEVIEKVHMDYTSCENINSSRLEEADNVNGETCNNFPHCEEDKDPPELKFLQDKTEDTSAKPVEICEARPGEVDKVTDSMTEIKNQNAVLCNDDERGIEKPEDDENRCTASEEIMINEIRLMDESYPDLPDDDLDPSVEDSTNIKPNDENPIVLDHAIDNIHNDRQFNHLKRIVEDDPISIYNPSDTETNLPERDPLGETEYIENNVEIPASERMWSGNTTENIPPALSEHNAYNFESEACAGAECEERLRPETTKVTENISTDEFRISESGHDTNLESDSIDNSESAQNPSELFFNLNQEKTPPSPYAACNELVATPPILTDYAHNSMSFDQPTFHVAQVASEQVAANNNRLSDSIEQHCDQSMSQQHTSQTTGLTNDLESIVNDLTMIVENSREDRSIDKCDDAGVIDSLENLLEK